MGGSKTDLGIEINSEGGVGEYVATYAGRNAFEHFDVKPSVKAAYTKAWDAMQDLIDLLEEEGVFDEAEVGST